MPRSRRDVSPAEMCETAVRLADEIGDREVARRIGVSQTTIGNWRRGGKPNRATIRKVDRWFVHEGHRHYKTGEGAPDAFLAVKAIVKNVPPRRRKRAARKIDDVIRDEYDRAAAGASPSVGGRLRKWIDAELR